MWQEQESQSHVHTYAIPSSCGQQANPSPRDGHWSKSFTSEAYAQTGKPLCNRYYVISRPLQRSTSTRDEHILILRLLNQLMLRYVYHRKGDNRDISPVLNPRNGGGPADVTAGNQQGVIQEKLTHRGDTGQERHAEDQDCEENNGQENRQDQSCAEAE